MLQFAALTPNSAIAQQVLKEHSGKTPDVFASLHDLFGWNRLRCAVALAEIQAKKGVVLLGSMNSPEQLRSMSVGLLLQKVRGVETRRTMKM